MMQPNLEQTLARLVQINSVNPSFDASSSGEAEIAAYIAEDMRRAGLEVEIIRPERPSVIARLRGTGGGRSLMLNGHIDTVGVAGMPEPFSGRIDGGRLYGRGAYDMKASIAASMAALRELAADPPPGDVILAAVADEEFTSHGTEDVLRRVTTDGAVCTEPTSLRTCLAHKGFVWLELRTAGRAAHGSRFWLGEDANIKMGRVLGRLDRLEQELRARQPHPLVGPPSLHAATLSGGTGWSTYAAECLLQVERRTIPGETVEQVRAEIEAVAAGEAEVTVRFARPPFEVDANAAIVRAVRASGGGDFMGDTPWMDSALLAEAGIETVVIGPHGDGAHAAVEWVDLESTVRLAEILRDTARLYCT
jgi:acetylornithine deacetylase